MRVTEASCAAAGPGPWAEGGHLGRVAPWQGPMTWWGVTAAPCPPLPLRRPELLGLKPQLARRPKGSAAPSDPSASTSPSKPIRYSLLITAGNERCFKKHTVK